MEAQQFDFEQMARTMAAYQAEPEPEWYDARPPYNPDSAVQKLWSDVMVWPRAFVRFMLWATFTWIRAAVTFSTAALLVVVALFH